MSDQSLEGRIALVTGASRGIGRAAALALADAGAHVIAVARTVGGLEELDDAIQAKGGSATLVPLDLKDSPGIDRMGAAIFERWGKLDILFANAGILGVLTPLTHLAPKVWDELMAVNLTANWRLIRSLDQLLRLSDAGRILEIERHQCRCAALGLDGVVQLFKPAYGARDRDHMRAGIRERQRRRPADAARCAGDQRDAP